MFDLTALLTVLGLVVAVALVGGGSWWTSALARRAEKGSRDVTAGWPDGLPRP